MKRILIHLALVIILLSGYLSGKYLKDKSHRHNYNHTNITQQHNSNHKHKRHKKSLTAHGFSMEKGKNHLAQQIAIYTTPIFFIIIVYLIKKFKSHIQWLKHTKTPLKKFFVIIHMIYFIDVILLLASGVLYTDILLFLNKDIFFMEVIHKLTAKGFLYLTIFHLCYGLYYAFIKNSEFCRSMLFLKSNK